jgi:putative membrane-bound dehydrogenase-like protein
MCSLPLSYLLTICACLFAAEDPPDLVKSIEQQRGGRHWIDQPTDPPKSPEDSHACFEMEPGFRIDLVAGEPVVLDPVAIDFDQRGRMFVVEYSDYPVGPKDPKSPPLSRIVLAEDTNSDGRMDRRTVFADHIRFCHSLMAFRDGILTCSDTEILYVADTDGDNVADIREIWFDGFVPPHPQMQIGCPRWGLDNWIYFTYGNGKVRCLRPGFETAEPVEIPRVDFRFHPETMKFEAVSGAGQFGNTIDSYGRRYFSSNRNPIMTDVLTMDQVRRNPFAGVSTGHTDVGPAGEKTQVFPRVPMKSNWLSHAGTHTSACGVTAYRGGLFGDTSDQSVFVCEPVGHLVTRSIIEPDGGTVTARRAREKADFLASSDTWFRPVGMITGPDGALYLADVYRLWVEHPKFVPDDVAAKMDWRAGEDRGRIWRIVPVDSSAQAAFVEPTNSSQLVALLKDSNGWKRTLGQRLLVERNLVEAETELRSLLNSAASADEFASGFERLHALWTLYGLEKLQPQDLIQAAKDPAFVVRRDAAKLSGVTMPNDAQLQIAVAELCDDPHGEVRMQALLAVDPMNSQSLDAVVRSTSMNMDNLWLQRGLLIAAPVRSAEMAAVAVAEAVRKSDASPEMVERRSGFLRSLAQNAAVLGSPAKLSRIAEVIGSQPERGLWWQTALVLGLADGLPRTQNAAVPKNLSALLQMPPEELKPVLSAVQEVVQLASETAVNRQRSDVDRVAAMGLMSFLPPESLTASLEVLLTPAETTSCQRAAIEAARRSGRPELASLVLAQWEQLKPQARSAAVDLLLVRKESILMLLTQMASGTVPSSVISIDQRLILLQHPDAAIRSEAAGLFGGAVSANRREVAEQYSVAIEAKGDVARGAALFEKTCSKCHRIGSVGHNVGPDISDTRARARDALLYDILDPNRRVDPQYSEYIVVTTDGRLLNGLMIAETSESVTVRQAEGREQTVPRNEIEELKASNKSLMPEGIERDVTVDQMTDLLEFLKSRS